MVPTVVREEVVTTVPSVVAESTSVPAILYVLVAERLADPATSSVYPGELVPTPILVLAVSKESKLDPTLSALTEEGSVHVEATPAERFSAPAEVRASVPDVAVCKVKLVPVVVNEEAPDAVREMAPSAVAEMAPDEVAEMAPAAAFPIVTAPVDVPVFMLVAKLDEAFRFMFAPDMVAPADPVKRPWLVRASANVNPADVPVASYVTAPASETVVV